MHTKHTHATFNSNYPCEPGLPGCPVACSSGCFKIDTLGDNWFRFL